MTALECYVSNLCQQFPEKRVYRFEFEGKYYWLKQPELVKGSQRLLKPRSHKAFECEVQNFIALQQAQAPIPQVYIANERMLVLEEFGHSVGSLLSSLSEQQIEQVLADSVRGLIALHQQNLTHGRPLLRDILWQDGQVKFIDFEMLSSSKNLHWNKVRDSILFIYGLCREEDLTAVQIRQTLQLYQQLADPAVWRSVLPMMKRLRLAYYLLQPFRKIARTDLKAFYLLVEVFMA